MIAMLDIVNSDSEIVNMKAVQNYMFMWALKEAVKDHGTDAAKYLVDAWNSKMANDNGEDLDDALVRHCYKFIGEVDEDKRQGKDLERLYPKWSEVSEESKILMSHVWLMCIKV